MRAQIATTLSFLSLTYALSFHPGHQASALVFDGRVPTSASGATFDAGLLTYNPTYDLGANLTWSQVLIFPHTPRSLFDNATTKAVEVTIDDRAIFTPSPTNRQTGFRRNELLPQPANATYAVTGVKTLHWSMMSDVSRGFNYSHEYQLVWLENQDYSADQFSMNVGTLYGANDTTPKQAKRLQLRGTSTASPQQTLWSTAFTDHVWHNLALVLDFNANKLKVYYSQGDAPLEAQTEFLPNDLSNFGEFHFGILKKPTGPSGIDVTKQGYQESGIHEGIVYGGIFEEDSAHGTVSLEPAEKWTSST